MFDVFIVHCELEVELQVTGEPVTCELAAAKKGKSHLFLSLSLLPAVWYEPKRMCWLSYLSSQRVIYLCLLTQQKDYFGVWSVE